MQKVYQIRFFRSYLRKSWEILIPDLHFSRYVAGFYYIRCFSFEWFGLCICFDIEKPDHTDLKSREAHKKNMRKYLNTEPPFNIQDLYP
jgi:hypothetical protein